MGGKGAESLADSLRAGEYTGGFTRRRAPFLFGYSVLYLIFLYTPPALLVLLAFNDSDETGLPFVGFTTRWFTAVFNNAVLLDSLWTSLQVAFGTVVVSAVFGTLAAVQIARVKGRLRSLNLGIISVPLFLPPLVLGLAIIVGLNALGIPRGLWTIIAGHTILTLPVVTILVPVRLRGARPQPGDRCDGPGRATLARLPHRIRAASLAGHPCRRNDRLCDLDG